MNTNPASESRSSVRVDARLIPALFVCGIPACLDRGHIGFAGLRASGRPTSGPIMDRLSGTPGR